MNKLKYISVFILLLVMLFPIINKISDANNINYTDKCAFKEEDTDTSKPKKTLNKQIMGNYYLVEDDWILGKFSKIIPKNEIKKYSKAVNELSKISENLGKDTYFVSMAHKTNMLRHLYPAFVDNKDNIDINKNALKTNLNYNNISFIDLDEYFLNNFTNKELEAFFFKTDHHWNGLGAYEGFKFMVKDLDLDLSDKEINKYFSKYKTVISDKKDFIGSYNSKLGYPVKYKDLTSYVYLENAKYKYFISDTKKDTKVKEEKIIASFRNKDSWDYGGAYMRGTNCNILKIKNNKSLTDKKVIVFRDSYQAPMTWMLADLFSQVEIVDPRYIENLDMTYEDIIKRSDSDIVLFMYNSFGFEGMIKEMIDKGIK